MDDFLQQQGAEGGLAGVRLPQAELPELPGYVEGRCSPDIIRADRSMVIKRLKKSIQEESLVNMELTNRGFADFVSTQCTKDCPTTRSGISETKNQQSTFPTDDRIPV